MVSGCTSAPDTSDMELLDEYNITEDDMIEFGGYSDSVKSIKLPEGTKTVVIKSNNVVFCFLVKMICIHN